VARDKKTNRGKKTVQKPTRSVRKPALDEALEFAGEFTAADKPVVPAQPAEPSQQPAPDPIDGLQLQLAAVQASPSIAARLLMPSGEKARETLRRRAAEMAHKAESDKEVEKSEEYIRFRLGSSEEYGIPYMYLDEILYATAITPVPCTPPHIAGIVNRRGEMLTVLDLQSFFQTQSTETVNGNDNHIIVVSGNNIRLGIRVEAVISNNRFVRGKLAPPLASAGVSNMDYIMGIYHGKVTMLNMEILLSDPSLTVNGTI